MFVFFLICVICGTLFHPHLAVSKNVVALDIMIYRNITDIKPNPKNPRVIKDDKFLKLVESLRTFPQMLDKRPLVCVTDAADGIIFPLGGNMRLKAAKELKMAKIAVTMADDWTKEQRQEFIIKDNVGFGEWDWDQLQADWDVEQLSDWGLDVPAGFGIAEATEDDYEIPDEIVTDILLGDLFEIGEHRLLCGSSTEAANVLKLMADKKADMLWTDPPYNVDYEGKTKDKLKIKNDDIKDFVGFLTDAFLSADAVLNPGAVYYIAHPDIFAYEFIHAVRACNWKQARPAVVLWVKDSLVMGRGDYHAQSEPILYGWKEGAAHLKVLTRTESNVWKIDRPKSSQEHPTMKPVGLVARAIINHSVGLILDLFLGSGTTMVAAHQLNRKCYGMELDPKYCQVIIDRMRKLDPALIIKKNGNAI